MSDILRNTLLGAAAVVAVHFTLSTFEHKHADVRPEPRYINSSPISAPPAVGTSMSTGSGMPLDGLKEMFEFAKSREAWQTCDVPDPGPTMQSGLKQATRCVYPEQVAGPHAVVNSYEDESLPNGGSDGGGVAAFDGWGTSAAF